MMEPGRRARGPASTASTASTRAPDGPAAALAPARPSRRRRPPHAPPRAVRPVPHATHQTQALGRPASTTESPRPARGPVTRYPRDAPRPPCSCPPSFPNAELPEHGIEDIVHGDRAHHLLQSGLRRAQVRAATSAGTPSPSASTKPPPPRAPPPGPAPAPPGHHRHVRRRCHQPPEDQTGQQIPKLPQPSPVTTLTRTRPASPRPHVGSRRLPRYHGPPSCHPHDRLPRHLPEELGLRPHPGGPASTHSSTTSARARYLSRHLHPQPLHPSLRGPQPRRVHQPEGEPAHLDHGLQRVARRPRLLGDDGALLAQQRVVERRLAQRSVGPPGPPPPPPEATPPPAPWPATPPAATSTSLRLRHHPLHRHRCVVLFGKVQVVRQQRLQRAPAPLAAPPPARTARAPVGPGRPGAAAGYAPPPGPPRPRPGPGPASRSGTLWRVNSPGSASRAPAPRHASSTSAGTSHPPWQLISTRSSPV